MRFHFDSNDAQFPHYSSPYNEFKFSDGISQSPLERVYFFTASVNVSNEFGIIQTLGLVWR